MKVDVQVECRSPIGARARQLEALFDVPHVDKQTMRWQGDVPIEDKPWNVGLIVGPSGAGKSSVMRQMFGCDGAEQVKWSNKKAVIDCFAKKLTMQEVTEACSAVGFNTIPAWMRPYGVLSTGEKFRATLARMLLEQPDPVVMDEFTSVVDRQVAKIGAHAVQRFARKNDRQFVAVTCHYDVVDWLQPDWVLEPVGMKFQWLTPRRSLRPGKKYPNRPLIKVTLAAVHYSAWGTFSPFHYMSAKLNRVARCFCLFIDGEPVAFSGWLRRPHPIQKRVMGCTRLVVLPDWQGLGLAFILNDALAAMWRSAGQYAHVYPAHPALIRSYDRSKLWTLRQKPGTIAKWNQGPKSTVEPFSKMSRPCAVFRYQGPEWRGGEEEARNILNWHR